MSGDIGFKSGLTREKETAEEKGIFLIFKKAFIYLLYKQKLNL
jgi:hypothetical protein